MKAASVGKAPVRTGQAEKSVNLEIKRILAVCGITGDCTGFVHTAGKVARGTGAELLVLTVIYNPFGVKGLSFPRPSLVRDYQELIERIRNDMQAIRRRERMQGLVIRDLVREGKPVPEILSVIREESIDLLILPSHEESWLEHFLFGKRNRTLLRKMPCSILYLKSEPQAVEEEEEDETEEWGMLPHRKEA